MMLISIQQIPKMLEKNVGMILHILKGILKCFINKTGKFFTELLILNYGKN
jgi:hypothetical protein